eukprot:2835384-Ditylum_brightwellii.AAC.1
MDAIDIDIFAWTETNVTWTQQLQTIAKQHTRNQFKQAKLVLSSIDKASTSTYQMGGMMVGMVGRTMGRVIATGTDPRGMGILAYVYITGKDSRRCEGFFYPFLSPPSKFNGYTSLSLYIPYKETQTCHEEGKKFECHSQLL